mgnify:FL=1|tara:strand:+ start:802 stop:1065 length:264 start_codon:yes stop_codon:yes gene_type:complete
MDNIETNLKNRLALLSIIQQSDWFKDLLVQPEKTQVELTEEGKDPNPAPPPNQPLAPEEPRSRYIVDTKIEKPNRDMLGIQTLSMGR